MEDALARSIFWQENEDRANQAARELQGLGQQPSEEVEQLLFLLALGDDAPLIGHLGHLCAVAESYTHPASRSFANHVLEDMTYDRGPFWPDWASKRAVRLLRQHGYDAGWYVGDLIGN